MFSNLNCKTEQEGKIPVLFSSEAFGKGSLIWGKSSFLKE